VSNVRRCDDWSAKTEYRLGDERQPIQHAGIEDTVQTPPAYGADQAFLLVEAQRRCRQA